MKKFGFLSLIVFAALSFLVSSHTFTFYDLESTIKLQKIIPVFLITPFSVFSLIGTAEIAGLVLLILLASTNKLNKISVLFLFVLSGIIEIFGKTIIRQKGPPIEFLKTDLHLNFPSSYIPKEFFSYPSGHSLRTAFISGILLFVVWQSNLSKIQKYIVTFFILAFDSLMFISRVYLGEHWLTDVLGGLILGFSFVLLVPYLGLKLKKWGINF